MPKLHYFYPENDLALARDVAVYTAPPAAVKLRQSGATLPFFYGDKADEVLAAGVNARWLGNLRDRLDIAPGVYRHNPSGFEAAPWGWSKASRKVFESLGFGPDVLPSNETIEELRNLSHRRTAVTVADALARSLPFAIAPAARELSTAEQVRAFVRECGPAGAVLKLPWSSSGRGVVFVDEKSIESQAGMIGGMLRRQGCVLGELRQHKLADFAMLFTMNGGTCRFDGYSLFENAGLAGYAGNILATQTELRTRLASLTGAGALDAVENALPRVLESVIGNVYNGPLGVDMMAVDNPDYSIDAVVEVNLRMTMGHVARIVYQRFVEQGATGRYSVAPAAHTGTFDATVRSGRILHGTLDLAQPGCDFSLRIDID